MSDAGKRNLMISLKAVEGDIAVLNEIIETLVEALRLSTFQPPRERAHREECPQARLEKAKSPVKASNAKPTLSGPAAGPPAAMMLPVRPEPAPLPTA